jgi:hypothetical protein
MIRFITRFFKAKGSLRFRTLYALDYTAMYANKRFFVTSQIEAGSWARLSESGYIYPVKKC